MKKNAINQSGFLHPRLIIAAALAMTASLLGLVSLGASPSGKHSAAARAGVQRLATTPSGGTLSPSTPEVTFTGGPFLIATNADDNASGPVICDAAHPCEDFALTIDI